MKKFLTGLLLVSPLISFSSDNFSPRQEETWEQPEAICSFAERDFAFMCKFKERCEVIDIYNCYEPTLNDRGEIISNWNKPVHKEIRYMTVNHWEYVLQWYEVDKVEIEEIKN